MTFDEHHLREQFGRIWPTHTGQFCELLVNLRRLFGGDLDLMLVLAVIGSRTLAWGRIQGLSYDEFLARAPQMTELAPINLQSIADYSGIPRETVRRKVQKLIARGWIVREADGYLYVTPAVAEHFESFNLETFNGVLAAAERLEHLAGAPTRPQGRDAAAPGRP